MSCEIFNNRATEYDAWYDTEVGKTIFAIEVDCLKPFLNRSGRPYLEIGVGSGRFAEALGIEYGIDPVLAMVQISKARGVKSIQAFGEELPFTDRMFGGLLIAFTLCFLENPQKAFQECWRVLQPEGRLVLGFIPRDSSWGKFYIKKGKEEHPIYSKAIFYSKLEVDDLLQQSGFKVLEYSSTLFQPPSQKNYRREYPVSGYHQSAGFVVVFSSKSHG